MREELEEGDERADNTKKRVVLSIDVRDHTFKRHTFGVLDIFGNDAGIVYVCTHST
jgi:hypothetical protein